MKLRVCITIWIRNDVNFLGNRPHPLRDANRLIVVVFSERLFPSTPPSDSGPRRPTRVRSSESHKNTLHVEVKASSGPASRPEGRAPSRPAPA
ncbi:hypothetical protein Zmor_002579 [Zophobas morio]|uniref:Uncharacterized protein n=1 Tax=Zophobas morio TaxID=2755281 RepID=A0AA38MTX1_9CUCU|nr:hypothetical protein Zmor_002579 [Zophobas morio]